MDIPEKICYAFRKYAESVWRDWITEHGEGIHHIAFGVEGADEVAQKLVDQFRAVIEQRGFYGDGSGPVYLPRLLQRAEMPDRASRELPERVTFTRRKMPKKRPD